MSNKTVDIDRLRVATPCPTTWEQMRGDARVRFCDVCQLNVYNIAELSRREAESLIASNVGGICARLYRRADGTILTKDCPVGLRALRMRISKRAAAVFALLAGISSAAWGQQTTPKAEPTACTPQTKITRTNGASEQSEKSLSGSVVDRAGGAVPAAQITVTSESTKEVITATTSESGKFEIALPPGSYSLKIEANGYQTVELANVSVAADQLIHLDTIVEISGQFFTGLITMPIAPVRPTPPGTTIISGDLLRKLPIQ